MIKTRMTPSRTYQAILRRHISSYTSIPSPFSSSLTITHQLYRPRYTSPLKARFHSTYQQILPSQQQTAMPDLQVESNPNSSNNEDWKTQPPYRTAPGNSHFPKNWTAHCHCGRIKYWLSRSAPLASKFCHCVDCQALHGAPFQWAAIFEKTDLHFESGVEGLAFYHSSDQSPEHKLPCKVSCAYCHSPIMDEGRRMVLIFPGIIEFGDGERKKAFDPQCHIFYSQRVVDMHDGKPKWSRLDGQSELMKEVDRLDSNSHTVLGQARNENVDN